VYVDTHGGVNLLSLPLDRLLQQSGIRLDPARPVGNAVSSASGASESQPAPASVPMRPESLRSRDRDSR
jgi:hypothetical protein